jgi:hypothetical protein
MLKRTLLTAGCSIAVLAAGCGSSGSSGSSSGGAAAAQGSSLSSAAAAGDYCTIAKTLTTASNSLSTLSPTTDLNQVKSLIAGFDAAVDAAASAAPSSMSADWNVLKTAYDQAATAVQSAKTTSDAFAVLSSHFNTPAINTAGKNIDTATKAACGFSISTESSSAAPTAPTPGTTETATSSSST